MGSLKTLNLQSEANKRRFAPVANWKHHHNSSYVDLTLHVTYIYYECLELHPKPQLLDRYRRTDGRTNGRILCTDGKMDGRTDRLTDRMIDEKHCFLVQSVPAPSTCVRIQMLLNNDWKIQLQLNGKWFIFIYHL